MKNNNEVEWILIEDKMKKEWKKQDAYKKEKKEDNKKIYEDFLVIFNDTTKKKFRILDEKTRRQLNGRIKEGYTLGDFQAAIKNCVNDDYHKKNPKYLTPEFITRSDKLQKYLNVGDSTNSGDSKAYKPQITQTFFD